MPAGSRRDTRPHVARELTLTAAGIAVTLLAAMLFLAGAGTSFGVALDQGRLGFALEVALFALLAVALIHGNLAYQLARLGYLRRLRDHRPEPTASLEALYDADAPPVQVLVPAYQEEPRVVRQTLLSAALQPYPGRSVVLLIDNRPDPPTRADGDLLESARRLPAEVAALLAEPAAWARAARQQFLAQPPTSTAARRHEARVLADLFDRGAEFLEQLAEAEIALDHTDALFVEQILRPPGRDLRSRASSLRQRARAMRGPTREQLARAYARLEAQFDVRLSSFERKRFVNLSHEPNKAMNLNSYIGLIGGNWQEVLRHDGLHLEPAERPAAPGDQRALTVPAAEAIVTLDADSLLLPDYVLRLMSVMHAPGKERLAIIQTPYSAVPGATSALEQTAGATTDIQYIIHQGFSRHDATFWVGANALIRKQALDEIATTDIERGHTIRRYIQDRTVIEDTESTIDLVSRGWQLVNYPARLSFSATPPDFGALVIQRRRWANGGLIILPKLLRHLVGGILRGRPAAAEGFMRSHYLVSIAATNTALLLMLAYPFPDGVASAWLPIAAAPYFVLYARDLAQAGYRVRDMLRVYALNLLLLPVNLGGVAKSIEQAVTRRKIPFGRTPKVDGRTAAPALYLFGALGLMLFWLAGSAFDVTAGRTLHATFAGVNAGLLAYAISRFIGWRPMLDDLRGQARAPELRPLRAAVRAARLSLLSISRLR